MGSEKGQLHALKDEGSFKKNPTRSSQHRLNVIPPSDRLEILKKQGCETNTREAKDLELLRSSRIEVSFCDCAVGTCGLVSAGCKCHAEGLGCHIETSSRGCSCGPRCGNPYPSYRYDSEKVVDERSKFLSNTKRRSNRPRKKPAKLAD